MECSRAKKESSFSKKPSRSRRTSCFTMKMKSKYSRYLIFLGVATVAWWLQKNKTLFHEDEVIQVASFVYQLGNDVLSPMVESLQVDTGVEVGRIESLLSTERKEESSNFRGEDKWPAGVQTRRYPYRRLACGSSKGYESIEYLL